MEMYKINISQIVSKYIGETEKNLQAVFAEARHANCILFFDECDALFGKRGEVKDSNDRSANVEVAYLLQQIEEYDGVCILATNLIGNIDDAFMRRITYVVHFPFPDAAMKKLIKRKRNQSFGKQLTILIALISVVLGAVAVTVSYRVYSGEITKYYDKTGVSLVKTLASQLTADDLDHYYAVQTMDDRYYKIQDFILSLVNNNDVEYLYVVRPNGTGVTFLFDSDLKTGEDGNYYAGGNCSLGTYVELAGPFAKITDQLLAGKEVKPIIAHDATYGWLMTAMCPVLHDRRCVPSVNILIPLSHCG